MNQLNTLSYYIATWFKVGLWPKMPGTWGSLMALPPALIISILWGVNGLVIASALFLVIGTLATYFVLHTTIEDDPSFVVIDEVVGQWMVLWFAGSDLRFWLLAFVLFRVFDILKPHPIKQLEIYFAEGNNLSKAIGIMIDDVMAASYAMVCLIILKMMFA